MEIKTSLINSFPDSIKAMWLGARNCYFKGDITSGECLYNRRKAIELLSRIYNKGHLSIFELAPFQFYISNASRSLLTQLTRHRVGWSFAVQSQHYQNHTDFKFKDLEQYIDEEHKTEYYRLMAQINSFYKDSLSKGLPKYIAREVLPNSTNVNIITTTNLKALDHFWKLRKGIENTPEIRILSSQTYSEVNKVILELPEIIQY